MIQLKYRFFWPKDLYDLLGAKQNFSTNTKFPNFRVKKFFLQFDLLILYSWICGSKRKEWCDQKSNFQFNVNASMSYKYVDPKADLNVQLKVWF